MIVDGQPVAVHGDKVACGATLISSVVVTTWGGEGSNSSGSQNNRGASNQGGNSLASNSAATGSTVQDEAHEFDLHFLIQDDKTGKPLANIPYEITLATGTKMKGVSDGNGLTEKVSADSPIIAKIEAPNYGDSTSNANSKDGHGACSC